MLILRGLAGSSFLALMAGAAFAQVTTVGTNRSEVQDSGRDNRAQVENSAEGNDRNSSLIEFLGNANRASTIQVGDDNNAATRASGDLNTAAIRQFGFRNRATLHQTGNGNGSSVDQYLDPRIDVVGDRIAFVAQLGDNNSSSVVQVAWNNNANVQQGTSNETKSHGAVSTIYQFSAGNTATVTMVGGSSDAANRSHVEQTRIDPIVTNNNATVNVNGSFNLTYLFQAGARNTASHSMTGTQNTIIGKSYGNDVQSSVVQEGFRNFATVNQFAGVRNSSRVWQLNGSAGDRQVYVLQAGSDNSSIVFQQLSQNTAFINQSGLGTESTIFQSGGGGFARVNLLDGSLGALNKSMIRQGVFREPLDTRLVADVTIRGLGNESDITQTGVRHVASVDIAGGGIGTRPNNSTLRMGNSVSIEQNRALLNNPPPINGAGHFARVQVGLVPSGGIGTLTSIKQEGEHASIGNDAIVRQDGQFDAVGVLQRTRYAGVDGGAVANVAARGDSNSISLAQYGRQFAFVTQGFGRDSVLRIASYDASGSKEIFFNGVSSGPVFVGPRGNNIVNAAQYGDQNTTDVWQEGTDNSATVWQKVGSSKNSAVFFQGRYVGDGNSIDGYPCTPQCQFAYNSSASITQAGRFNWGFAIQYGRGSKINIEQYGSGAAFPLITQASVYQYTGTAEASILQTEGVGPSSPGDPSSGAPGDPKYFAGGARSAEARIQQSGLDLSARIEQRGRGQRASIEQSGTANLASILQDANATNATAIITQSGSGNSYNVGQTQPGQYINVSQTGTNNSVTNVITRP